MSEYEPYDSRSDATDSDELLVPYDIQDVVATLQKLVQKAGHPDVRASLEQARDDIIHLTSYGAPVRVDHDGEAATTA